MRHPHSPHLSGPFPLDNDGTPQFPKNRHDAVMAERVRDVAPWVLPSVAARVLSAENAQIEIPRHHSTSIGQAYAGVPELIPWWANGLPQFGHLVENGKAVGFPGVNGSPPGRWCGRPRGSPGTRFGGERPCRRAEPWDWRSRRRPPTRRALAVKGLAKQQACRSRLFLPNSAGGIEPVERRRRLYAEAGANESVNPPVNG